MEPISKINEVALRKLETNSTTSPDETLKPTGLPISWTSALFKRFQAIYGHRFTSSIEGIEDIATHEWAHGMAGITGEQIKNGLAHCAKRALYHGEQDWPPTLAEFRAMCVPEKIPAAHRDYKQLPKPPQDKDKVALAIEAMRKKLG